MSGVSMILGAPFFRSYGIVLSYKDIRINIWGGNKTEESTIATPPTPPFLQLVLNQTLKSNDLLAGDIFVGTPSQSNYNVAYWT
jgi:hypothetical protein